MKKLDEELRQTRLVPSETVASPLAKLASLEQQKSEAVSPTLVQIMKDGSKNSSGSGNLVTPKSISDGSGGDGSNNSESAQSIVKSG
jgi:hypothetical protein